MKHPVRWIAATIMGAGWLLASVAAAQPDSTGKKLIEMGWDEPDTRFLRDHITQLQASPFDGCVFHVGYRKPDGSAGNFTWDLWGRRRFQPAELDTALADLKATRYGRFTENFLRINVTPGNLDWFEDHAAVMANLQLAARVARLGGCKGVLFDVEQYQGQLFEYRSQTAAGTRSWTQVAAQVRARGREAMDALQAGFPGLTVFMTWGYSLPMHESIGGRKPLADCHYGLLAPFVDGLFDRASGATTIVDGHEISYSYRSRRQFTDKADSMRFGVMRMVADPGQYRRHGAVSFGLWLDYDSNHRGWFPDSVQRNYFTPVAFDTVLNAALEQTDRYVWVYGEQALWWTAAGGRLRLPAAYDSVLRRARR